MVVFSTEQLALLQAALSPPMPQLVAPPQLAPPGPPPAAPARRAVPLTLVLAGYGVVLAALSLTAAAAPRLLPDAGLLASPALAGALQLHALALAAPPAQALAAAAALGAPWAFRAAAPAGMWAAAAAVSAFLALAAPPGLPRFAASLGAGGVLLAGGLLAAAGPIPPVVGLCLACLALQVAASGGRLWRGALRLAVADGHEG
jgi:hypothetical protein